MGPRRSAAILEETARRAHELAPSTVTGNVADYRRSNVIWQGQTVAPDVADRLRAMAPELARVLGVAPFAVGEVETQVTVSRDGDFFKEHDDNGSPDTAARRLSWVYYVHRAPRAFDGGELVMYGVDGGSQKGAYVIEPENDTLVVFPSDVLHEVRPVRCASPAAADGRITVNGWIRELQA